MPTIINLVKHRRSKYEPEFLDGEEERVAALLPKVPDYYHHSAPFTAGKAGDVFLGNSKNKLCHLFLLAFRQLQAQKNIPIEEDYKPDDVMSEEYLEMVNEIEGIIEISANRIPPELEIPDEIKNALGDKVFKISQRDFAQLARSVTIFLDSRLPPLFYQAICQDLRFLETDYDIICGLPMEFIDVLQPLAQDVRAHYKTYGFATLEQANELLSMSLHTLGNFITISQDHFNFLGQGNQIQEKPANSHKLLSLAGIDFQRDFEMAKYFKEDDHAFISDEHKEMLNQRIKDLLHNALITSEKTNTKILSQLAIGAGAYLNSIANSQTRADIFDMYIKNTLDLLKENNYGLEVIYFHPGQYSQRIREILADYEEQEFPCQIIFQNEKDAGQVANEASKVNPHAATINPGDQAVQYGHNVGKHYEQKVGVWGGLFAGEEMYACYSTYKVLDPTICKAFDDLSRIFIIDRENNTTRPSQADDNAIKKCKQLQQYRNNILNNDTFRQLYNAVMAGKNNHDSENHQRASYKFWANNMRDLDIYHPEKFRGDINIFIEAIITYMEGNGTKTGRMHKGSLKTDIMYEISKAFRFEYRKINYDNEGENNGYGNYVDALDKKFLKDAKSYKREFYENLRNLKKLALDPLPAPRIDNEAPKVPGDDRAAVIPG